MTFGKLFGQINRVVKELKERKELKTTANQVIGNINKKYPGEYLIEEAVVKRKTEDTTLALTLNSSAKTITAGVSTNFVTSGFAVGQIIYIIDSSLTTTNNSPLTIANIGDAGGTNNQITVSETIEAAVLTAAVLTGYEVDSNYMWDHSNKKLTLADHVKETLAILVDNSDGDRIEYESKQLSTIKDTNNSSEEIYAMLSNYVVQFTSEVISSIDDAISVEMIKRIPKNNFR